MSYPVIPITTLAPQQSVGSQALAVPNTAPQPVQMMFLNDGSCLLNVVNTSVNPYAISVLAVPDMAGRTGTTTTPTGYAVTLAAPVGPAVYSEVYLGPFRQSWWNQTTGDVGYVYVRFGALNGPDIAGLTVEVINF